MNQELKACIEELRKTQDDAMIGGAIAEYAQIVQNVAKAYDFITPPTIQRLREDYPELDFMEDDELEDILSLAGQTRARQNEQEGREPFKVSAETSPGSLAGAIASAVREEHRCPTLQAIGAEAVNQANKAVAAANGMLAPIGIRLLADIMFQDLELDGQKWTAMLLKLREME